MKSSSFVCDCIKESSSYVIAFLLSMSGRKKLLVSGENAAGPMKVP